MRSVNYHCDQIKNANHKDNNRAEDGTLVFHYFHSSDRYVIDFAERRHAEGWWQFDTDQDAWYFGLWVNPKRLATLCYAEGDWRLVEFLTPETYNAEINRLSEAYGEGFILKEFHVGTGHVTTHRQDRAKFVIA